MPKAGTCARCVADGTALDRLFGTFLYESPVGNAVRTLKFDDLRALGAVLGGLFDVDPIIRANVDLIVPIPLHRSRMRSRGFNQSEMLARSISKRVDVPFSGRYLERSIDGVAQANQPSAKARREAVRGIFRVPGSVTDSVAGKRVLLVDDVFTTGSTITSAASALKNEGASWVGAAVLTVQPVGSLK